MARMKWKFLTEPTCRDGARARQVRPEPHQRNAFFIRVIREIRCFILGTGVEPANRIWPRENTARATTPKNDRIMAGQNHKGRHRPVLMSCHDSVCLPRLQKKRKRDIKQEAAER